MRNNCGSYKSPTGTFVRYGVGNPGGSDLIGLRTVTITPQMVGQQIGQFVAVEVKRPGEKPTEQQQRFMAMVRQLGGVAGVARSVDDARDLLSSTEDVPLSALELSTGTYHALRRAGLQWVRELDPSALADLSLIGPGRAQEIVTALQKWQRGT